jgi:hypothetical protein
MTLDEFTDITVRVIEDSGIADYLPTIALPHTECIQAIKGIPTHIEHTDAIQTVAARSGFEKAEFFFGVRSGKGQITTGHYRPDKRTAFMLIQEETMGYSVKTLESCAWWTFGLQQGASPNASELHQGSESWAE